MSERRRSAGSAGTAVNREPTSERSSTPQVTHAVADHLLQPEGGPHIRGAERQVYPVFLHPEWYVPVDEQGMVMSSCAEGALGYIVQLLSTDLDPPLLGALKIPRLRADTMEENAYICQTLANEAQAVFKALGGQRDEGLIPIYTTRTAHFLRDPRALARSASPQAREQHDCIPFIHLGKDERLQICNVKFEPAPENGPPRLRVFPPTLEPQLSFLTYEDWRQFQLASAPDSESRGHAFYFDGSPNRLATDRAAQGHGEPATSRMKHLDQMLNPERPEHIWYAHLPSVLFKWADCTLQRTLSIGAHRTWRLKEHYKLLQRVVQGLQTLHAKGIIHADVRPANIMALGNPTVPEHYNLSDFGSFSNDQASAGGGGGTGFTTMPGVTRHRTSVFYARERRAGEEQENADVALIIGEQGGATHDGRYLVRLGWKAEVIDPESGRVYPEVIRDMESVLASMLDASHKGSDMSTVGDDIWRLKAGDQIRLRDYVFKLIDMRDDRREVQINDQRQPLHCRDFLCDSRYTRVLLEKLAVRGQTALFDAAACSAPRDDKSVLVLDLPRWVGIRQSSVASDLYSVGVMALYTVYTNARLNKRSPLVARSPDAEPSSVGSSPTIRADLSSLDMPDELEGRIANLVRRLEDEKNFNELWLNLTRACTILESALRAGCSVDQLLAQPLEHDGVEAGPHGGTRVKDFIESVVEGLCNHAEELREIAEWSNNSAYFLLFVHFVLSCMHRRSHLDGHRLDQLRRRSVEDREKLAGIETLLYPFCRDRCERTTEGAETVAARALERLHRLILYFDQKIFFKELQRRLEPNTNGSRSADSEVANLQLQLRGLRIEREYQKEELRILNQRHTEQLLQLRQQHHEELSSQMREARRIIEAQHEKYRRKQAEFRKVCDVVKQSLPAMEESYGRNQARSRSLDVHSHRAFEQSRELWQILSPMLEEKGKARYRIGKGDEEAQQLFQRLSAQQQDLEHQHETLTRSLDTVVMQADQFQVMMAILANSDDDDAVPEADAGACVDTGPVELLDR